MRATLQRRDDPAAIEQADRPVGGVGSTDLRLSSPPLGLGDFVVRGDALDSADTAIATHEATLTRRQPPWWENIYGESVQAMPDRGLVPSQRVAVRVSGRRLTFTARWGRCRPTGETGPPAPAWP